MNDNAEPIWLGRQQAISIHDMCIAEQGGSPGIRDEGLLESALARPQNSYAYGENDIFLLAAAYAEAIARNHAFVDGNKRTAYATADMFLYQNGYDLGIKSAAGQIALFEALATGQTSRDQLAEFYRLNSSKTEES